MLLLWLRASSLLPLLLLLLLLHIFHACSHLSQPTLKRKGPQRARERTEEL